MACRSLYTTLGGSASIIISDSHTIARPCTQQYGYHLSTTVISPRAIADACCLPCSCLARWPTRELQQHVHGTVALTMQQAVYMPCVQSLETILGKVSKERQDDRPLSQLAPATHCK